MSLGHHGIFVTESGIMADERQGNAPREGGNEGGRDGRRRYFRRRQRPDRPPREGQGAREQEPRPGQQGGRVQEQPQARRRPPERQEREDQDFRNGRTGRRRRRTRGKGGNGVTQRNETPVIEDKVDTDNYVAPTTVYVYTHVSRPGSARDSYEFRSEHFSKVGRRLEEYEIDLSKIFPDAPNESSKDLEIVADLDETE